MKSLLDRARWGPADFPTVLLRLLVESADPSPSGSPSAATSSPPPVSVSASFGTKLPLLRAPLDRDPFSPTVCARPRMTLHVRTIASSGTQRLFPSRRIRPARSSLGAYGA